VEQIVSVIPGVYQPKALGRRDNYTLVCTDKRTIFARLTPELMKDAVKHAQDEAKAEGKGFFGRWGAQIASGRNFHARYRDMAPEDILNQAEGNFDINHDSLIKLKAKKKVEHNEDSFDVKTDLQYETPQGKRKYLLDEYSKATMETLSKIYGTKLEA